MELVSKSRIETPAGAKCFALDDGSLTIVKYKELKRDILEVAPSHYGNYYSNKLEVTINLPEHAIEYIIHIFRTSVNMYRVVFSDFKRTDFQSFGNYYEINNYLRALPK